MSQSGKERPAYKIAFAPGAWEQYTAWQDEDKVIATRITDLINDIRRTPFTGIGKPEPLKGDKGNWWSRRITKEHRLVYRLYTFDYKEANVEKKEFVIQIHSCRMHYD